jgi:hypothetical protein
MVVSSGPQVKQRVNDRHVPELELVPVRGKGVVGKKLD